MSRISTGNCPGSRCSVSCANPYHQTYIQTEFNSRCLIQPAISRCTFRQIVQLWGRAPLVRPFTLAFAGMKWVHENTILQLLMPLQFPLRALLLFIIH